MKTPNFYLLLCAFLSQFLTTTPVFAGEHTSNASEKAVIASGGKAFLPIIISMKADKKVKRSAAELAHYLSRMSGGKFELKTGDGKNGIAVGTINDFPDIPFKPHFDLTHPGECQGYEIKSHSGGIYVIAATPKAIEYAVYDLLRRLGYRRYFPMKKWEIVPRKNKLAIAVHIRETPDYFTRLIWSGYGTWSKEFLKDKLQWDKVNRGGGFNLQTGHAYGRIIRKFKKEFNAHPEYYALLKGKRKSSKLCISNPNLRKLVSDYAVGLFEKNPTLDCVSMEPTDGGGWCECAECAKLGPPSDRALLLANTVAEAVRKKFPGKRIAMYAYNQHSTPPSFDVHPNVIVNVATSFIKGGYTVEEIIDGWRNKKATLGVREYYDVYIWSANAPGKGKGGNLKYLKKSIPNFYKKGARYMSAEASDDWGGKGLGYYLALRMLWNIEDSKKLDSLSDDFYRNCFGPAATTMKKFYGLLNGGTRHELSSDLLGRMYRLLSKARKKAAGNSGILARLDDLALYTRYCEILKARSMATGKAKTRALTKQMLQFAARIKNTRMVHTFAMKRVYTKRLAKGTVIDWENAKPFTEDEINNLIDKGIAANKLLDFTPLSFSSNLVPAPALLKESFTKGKFHRPGRGVVTYYTWVDEKLRPIELSITGGMIYRSRGNVKIKFYKIGGASDTGTKETLIQTPERVPPNKKKHIVTLNPKQPGLHKIVISDGGDATFVRWPKGTPMTFHTGGKIFGNFCFYVPKGTKTIGIYCYSYGKRGGIISPEGKRVFPFRVGALGFCSIPVPKGMDGRLWKIHSIMGFIKLLTVPPYLAIEPAGLLLPKEVVKKDKLNEL